jgi:hypothetical protein
MNYKDITRQTMIEPGKALHELGYKTLDALHENTERAVNAVLAKAPWVTDDSRNTVHEWFEAVKTGRNNIKGLVDQNIKTFEGFIASL